MSVTLSIPIHWPCLRLTLKFYSPISPSPKSRVKNGPARKYIFDYLYLFHLHSRAAYLFTIFINNFDNAQYNVSVYNQSVMKTVHSLNTDSVLASPTDGARASEIWALKVYFTKSYEYHYHLQYGYNLPYGYHFPYDLNIYRVHNEIIKTLIFFLPYPLAPAPF